MRNPPITLYGRTWIFLALLISFTYVPLTIEAQDFQSASVLPCYYNRDENEMYYLIGKERANHPPALWADFGGKKDRSDKRPSETAVRELSEETIGALDTLGAQIKNKLKCTSKIQSHRHVIYIASMNYPNRHFHEEEGDLFSFQEVKNLRAGHAKRLRQPGLKRYQKEKTELAWLKASDLIHAFYQDSSGRIRLNNAFTAYSEPRDPLALDSTSFPIPNVHLRGCMAGALSHIAEELGAGGFNQGFLSLHGQEALLRSQAVSTFDTGKLRE